jgi:hypothetical protein
MTSILKADTIQDADGNNIINESGNTITIGASGDTITIPSGATISNSGTATGFGGGKINQVLTTTTTVDTSISSDAELFSLAITPTSTSSKILAIVGVTAQLDANEYASFDLYRGSLASGTKIYDGADNLFNSADIIRVGYSFSYTDSPSTTSATTYTVVGVPQVGTIRYGAAGRQSMTLMEVLA